MAALVVQDGKAHRDDPPADHSTAEEVSVTGYAAISPPAGLGPRRTTDALAGVRRRAAWRC
jgi:hypothetical protein